MSDSQTTTSKNTSVYQPTRWKSLDDLTRTKTIATIGPACNKPQQLAELILQGVDVFRINMAHGDREQHQQALDDIRWASNEVGVPVGALIDLAGPKIRLGQLFEDPLNCVSGSSLTFVRGEVSTRADELVCTYSSLLDEIEVGDWVMLRDGLVRLLVEEKSTDSARCLVVDGGIVRSRQGVNLPGTKLSVPALGDVDRANAIWAAEQGVDFVSLSFVRNAGEIEQLQKLLHDHQSRALTVAKIEKREALENLESIVRMADAIMVARGDLGVEIEIEKTPMAQKRIIKTCQSFGKPVIVATQMLESMHESMQPTRAEVSDVANAILDGADACMLSGETAIGNYPRQSVKMMRKVMIETEQSLRNRRSREGGEEQHDLSLVSQAVVFGAAQIAKRLRARLVVIATSRGDTALIKSKQRDFIPTVAVTDNEAILRRMCLYWGVTPVLSQTIQDPDHLRKLVNDWADQDYSISPGDMAVFVMDTNVLPGIHDIVMVAQVGGSSIANPE